MKSVLKYSMCLVALGSTLLLHGCFGGIGKDLGSGLREGFEPGLDTLGASLGSGLVRSIRDTLLSDQTREGLAQLVDSVFSVAGTSLGNTTVAVRDSLLGEATRLWVLRLERDMIEELVLGAAGIRDQVLGEATRRDLELLRRSLMGESTALFVAAMRDTLLGEGLRFQIGLLRDELLGPNTQSALDSLIERTAAKVQRVTREEETFLKRNITEILWTAGAIIGLLLLLGWWIAKKRNSYKKMLETVAFQIHESKNRGDDSFEKLASAIQRDAKKQGIEPTLNKFLVERGLLKKK